MIIRSQYNYEQNLEDCEDYTDVASLTVESESETIEEILNKYSRGIPVRTQMSNLSYDSDINAISDAFNNLDDIYDQDDKLTLLSSTREKIINLENKIKSEKILKQQESEKLKDQQLTKETDDKKLE